MKMSQAYQRILVLKLVQSGLLKLGLASCCFFVRSDAHIGTVPKNACVVLFTVNQKGSDV